MGQKQYLGHHITVSDVQERNSRCGFIRHLSETANLTVNRGGDDDGLDLLELLTNRSR